MFAGVSRRVLASAEPLCRGNLNKQLVRAEYAVRGALVLRAQELEKSLKDKQAKQSLPFDSIVYCNIGNPQQLGQKPLTFGREVLALVSHPALLRQAPEQFSSAARERAEELLGALSYGTTGQYTESLGMEVVRKHVAQYISERDGHAADPARIALSDGASPGIKNVLNAIIRDEGDAIMTPVPQYPLYSASIALFGGTISPYYLDFSDSWAVSRKELKRSVEEARSKGKAVRALVVINPGNPTGATLTRQTMEDVIGFCEEEGLVLLADEVYQSNVYDASRPFVSFKKVVADLQSPVQLFSFHSTSKGFLGECGRRGGYTEAHNVADDVWEQLYKMASLSLCSNVDGQVMVSCMTKPPAEGSDAFEVYEKERDHILSSLATRAKRMVAALNEMEGVRCNPAQSAMYVNPRIALPKKFVDEAEKAGKVPDAVYCMRLLEKTGVCVVPGSGFHQEPGTYHFRSTFLPQDEEMEQVIVRMKDFHAAFMDEYR